MKFPKGIYEINSLTMSDQHAQNCRKMRRGGAIGSLWRIKPACRAGVI
jgi:hypothetical protein